MKNSSGGVGLDRSDKTDRELIVEMKSGDHDAYGLLYQRHGLAVYLYCASMVGRGFEAEDAAQETWLALWRARHRIDVTSDSTLPWLLVTARHKCLHALVRSKRANAENQGINQRVESPEQIAETHDLQRRVDAVIARMPQVDQELFARCVVADETYSKASRALGLSEGAARSRLARMRKTIRIALRETN